MSEVLSILKSKRFAVLLLLLGLVVAGDRTGLTPEQRQQAVLGLGAFILSDGVRPVGKKEA